jgi:predicted membrane-bound spermidine synthase
VFQPGRSPEDVNGILRPYALTLFHPAPRDVLMIGLSSGSWAKVVANNPAVASLTVVEINPGYMRLVQDTPAVASVLRNPKVTVITDDGRRWLRLNPGRRMGLFIRTIGIARAKTKILANLVYNIKRLLFLRRIAAARSIIAFVRAL